MYTLTISPVPESIIMHYCRIVGKFNSSSLSSVIIIIGFGGGHYNQSRQFQRYRQLARDCGLCYGDLIGNNKMGIRRLRTDSNF